MLTESLRVLFVPCHIGRTNHGGITASGPHLAQFQTPPLVAHLACRNSCDKRRIHRPLARARIADKLVLEIPPNWFRTECARGCGDVWSVVQQRLSGPLNIHFTYFRLWWKHEEAVTLQEVCTSCRCFNLIRTVASESVPMQ